MSEGNTLSIDDRELIDDLRFPPLTGSISKDALKHVYAMAAHMENAADRLESLLSERDKLEEALERALLDIQSGGHGWSRAVAQIRAALNRTANNG